MLSLTVLSVLVGPPTAMRLEAEDARIEKTQVTAVRSGYSGRGYVTGFVESGSRIVWNVQAKDGLYEAVLGFSTPNGEKGCELGVNGVRSSAMLPATGPQFRTQSLGKIELREGKNELSVERGWGYYDVDYLELRPAWASAPPRQVPNRLSDRQASAEAKALYARLVREYGRRTFSGQYDQKECDFVSRQTGQTPAILGGDLMDYSPSRLPFGAKPDGTVESYLAAAEKGQILTLSWHWNAPKDLLNKKFRGENGQETDASWYRGFYTNATTFDIAKAMSQTNSEEYRLIVRDIDAIAVQLKKLADAHVPVLWRPLHEADGGWFWWGAKGPEPCRKLWRLLYDRLTHRHGLHNLIWVWNSPKAEWYPGDDVVDVMSVDEYPSDRRDVLTGAWETLLAHFDGRKPLALAEFPGAPDTERMRRFGIRWLFFVSWTGGVGPSSTPKDVLRSTYRSRSTINAPR